MKPNNVCVNTFSTRFISEAVKWLIEQNRKYVKIWKPEKLTLTLKISESESEEDRKQIALL